MDRMTPEQIKQRFVELFEQAVAEAVRPLVERLVKLEQQAAAEREQRS